MNKKQLMKSEWKVNETLVYVEGDDEDFAICNTEALNTNTLPHEICLEMAKQIADAHNLSLKSNHAHPNRSHRNANPNPRA